MFGEKLMGTLKGIIITASISVIGMYVILVAFKGWVDGSIMFGILMLFLSVGTGIIGYLFKRK